MSEIPWSRARKSDPSQGLDVEKHPGLDPLHMEPPQATGGLRPLGQVDGLDELRPATAIMPTADEPDRDPVRVRARRLATGLDWDSLGGPRGDGRV